MESKTQVRFGIGLSRFALHGSMGALRERIGRLLRRLDRIKCVPQVFKAHRSEINIDFIIDCLLCLLLAEPIVCISPEFYNYLPTFPHFRIFRI